MAHTVALKPPVEVQAAPAGYAEPARWFLWAGLLASTSAVVGGHWDISWHRGIGRDTFWTPAHIAIYLCGIIAGFSGAWVVLSATFGRVREQASVRIWGFRGPLGAFLGIWGAVAMLTSAPFDDWWHSAYGLDVKILSPPHTVLAMGLVAIELGALVQVLGAMNRAPAAPGNRDRRLLEWMFLYGALMLFLSLQTIIMEHSFRIFMHQPAFYRTTGLVTMLVLPGVALASGRRWASATVAAGYSLFIVALILILPLFPAEPKLGPVYQPVTHFIPPQFPQLYIFPALVLDWLLNRHRAMNRWKLAVLAGGAFLAVYLAVQWPFADFLQSPYARNWFFGSHYLGYYVRPESFTARYLFVPTEAPAAFLGGLAVALAAVVLAARVSLGWGEWMRKIQR